MATIGIITHAVIAEQLEAQARQRADTEASALVDEFNHGGRVDLDVALAGRLANRDVTHRYAVIEADGRVSLGDPSLAQTMDSASPAVRATRALGDGSRVVVQDDLSSVRTIEKVVQRAFTLALGMAAGLGLATGLLLSNALLGRMDRITRTADAVTSGDLTLRIPARGTGDEFDRLAVVLNRMLDQIGGLLNNLQQVSTDIAHDLRTPLSRLRQSLEAASRRATTVEAYRTVVEEAVQEIDRALAIFSALLRIAQVEAGARRVAFRPVNLSDVLQTVADAYAAPAADGGRPLQTAIAEDVWVEADRDLLVQLFANLVENALQHTPSGTRIDVALHSAAGSALARIRDDGPGIPQTEWGNVFRRFYRLERSRTSAGNGLGLSLVAAIVDLHRARIAFADGHPGLQITVTVPVLIRNPRDQNIARAG